MSNETVTTNKQGRTKGSKDSVMITLETLLKYVKPDHAIPVRRKWIEDFERFFNVTFVEEESQKTQEKVTIKLQEESLDVPAPEAQGLGVAQPEVQPVADASQGEIRQRLEIASEPLD